jgi:ABC-2 type transport system permease protein
MRNILSVARRIVIQIGTDPRTVALILAAPLLIMTVLWLVLNSAVETPRLAVYGLPDSVRKELSKDAELTETASPDEGRDLVIGQKQDAFLDWSVQPPRLVIDSADPAVTALVSRTLQKTMVSVLSDMPFLGAQISRMKPDLELLYANADATTFDFMSPILMGFVIFFFIFILSGVSFLRERLSGTLERMLVAPTRHMEVVLGYILGFGFFAVVQTVLIQAFMIGVLRTPSRGDFLEVLAVNLLLCLVGLSMGSLISAFAANEFQVFQFIPLVITPQVLFSGIFDLRQAPGWLRTLSWFFPLTYGGQALRQVMVRGLGLGSVLPQLGMLLAFSLAFILLNSAALRIRKD